MHISPFDRGANALILVLTLALVALLVPTVPAAVAGQRDVPSDVRAFRDDFSAKLDPDVYRPLGGATLEVTEEGRLRVTPGEPGDGVIIVNPFPPGGPISPTNTPLGWRAVLEFTPDFPSSTAGEMQLRTLGPGERVMEMARYDNVTDRIYVTVGDHFGGTETRDVGIFVSDATIREVKAHRCTWLPPGWQRRSCCYYILPPVAYWTFGAFGDAPVDASLNDVGLEALELTSTAPFEVSLVEFQVGGDIPDDVEPWVISPSHVDSAGGSKVTIVGDDIAGYGPFSLTVGGVPAVAEMVDANTIRFTAPAGEPGLADVLYRSDDGGLMVLFDNDFRYIVGDDPLLLVHGALPTAIIGARYAKRLEATGGDGVYSFHHASGNLPAGIALKPDGTLSGAAQQAGDFAFFVQVTDGIGNEDVRMFYLQSRPGPVAHDPIDTAP
jgi:hypothetical protein